MNNRKIQRNTRQRQVIIEELRKLTSHPTAAGLYEIVRRRLPRISLGTVYRNLELLAELGMVLKLDYAGAEARYDGNTLSHDHVRCVRCGRVDDVSAGELDFSLVQNDVFGGYKIIGHRLEFLGVCPDCQCKETKSNKFEDEKH